jgi:hypothetical protein
VRVLRSTSVDGRGGAGFGVCVCVCDCVCERAKSQPCSRAQAPCCCPAPPSRRRTPPPYRAPRRRAAAHALVRHVLLREAHRLPVTDQQDARVAHVGGQQLRAAAARRPEQRGRHGRRAALAAADAALAWRRRVVVVSWGCVCVCVCVSGSSAAPRGGARRLAVLRPEGVRAATHPPPRAPRSTPLAHPCP